MARILGIFLIILVMNQQAMSFSIFGIDIAMVKQAYDFINMVYHKGMEFANRDVIAQTNPEQRLHDIMAEIRSISTKLVNFENSQDERIDVLEDTLLNNIVTINDFGSARSDLVKYISDVDKLFKKGMEYKVDGSYNTKTLEAFVKAVLSNNNMENLLFKIKKIILPGMYANVRKGLISLAYKYSMQNYKRLCDKNKSQQQHLYYVFMLLIRTHLRGFTTITQAYSIRSIYDNSSYAQEYKDSKEKLQNQLTNYIKVFIEEMNDFPADIRRCSVQDPIIGENVLEIEGLTQVIVNFETTIKNTYSPESHGSNYYASGGCEDITNIPKPFAVSNCTSKYKITGCPTQELSGRSLKSRFSWFTADEVTYGHSGQCNYTSLTLDRALSGVYWDDLCVCSAYYTHMLNYDNEENKLDMDKPAVTEVSLEPQLSDIPNNMVVVGVKFIIQDKGIHLQIKQSKISEVKSVAEKGVWKPVDVDNNNEKLNVNYFPLGVNHNKFYLDNVMVHPDFIVTGVKFHLTEDESGFELHVHGTKFDPETGKLSGEQIWFKPGEYSYNLRDYIRNRTEIIMNDPDDPTLTRDYFPDIKSNVFIKLQPSSLKKDAGYHTVPFFDGQSVESPLFPLGGIGLFHRYRNGFGGYIAPRLLTYNITWDMEASFNNWQKIENKYKECGLEIPPNVKTVDEDATCESLEQVAKNHIEIQDGEEIDYRTNYIRHPSRSHHYSHSRRTQHDSTEDDDARNTISKNF